ncbi:hypothetical protein LX15_000875 [Streptoalloteichus tenebrarius]|uniref:Transposase n=1 Tax=Streptoalloteichus tenebrarius (strain ATCC 17920 / DSM 40477 / JCM 4838 / CBS 697.72 / NBRC 16177 / NCIMB 11028 / NRRL B-12390 / A12253. 1 / ISP 5477) TaxID=1933 RepID=A0ABT1HNV6_STRSD|nr:hypothetical protein [Streptoalloteichus tenebrarius]MCP2257190.1 hypothetical protein [Streptoalloteichus tenebrarius]BFE98823.1 hypothetical protein GCM10020241_04990 [Streptoalloteichus tenebrarius]
MLLSEGRTPTVSGPNNFVKTYWGRGYTTVAQALNVHYKAEHADNPVTVTTPDEVRALLAVVRDAYPGGKTLCC